MFSFEVLLTDGVFVRSFDLKLRFRSKSCSKVVFPFEVLFKVCVFV